MEGRTVFRCYKYMADGSKDVSADYKTREEAEKHFKFDNKYAMRKSDKWIAIEEVKLVPIKVGQHFTIRNGELVIW